VRGGDSEAVHRCLIGFTTAAVPSQFLQITSELISLTRLLLRIKEDVGGDQPQIGTNLQWLPHRVNVSIIQLISFF